MKRFLVVTFKLIFLVLLLAAVVLVAYLSVTRWGLPWWLCAAVALGVLGIVLGIVLLKRWRIRRREERFVKRIIVEQDELLKRPLPVQELQQVRNLEERWQAFIETLRQSHLRKLGNPLYVLPWYLILGEPGSGKTTAIQSARVPFVLTDLTSPTKVMQTENCDWWFFEDSIFIDTAGHYALSDQEEVEQKEWHKFLTLLARYRKREPLSGLIITLPTDKLTGGDSDALVLYGRGLRQRINEIMQVLGARFPIYVLVTKMDKIVGMNSLADLLPEEQLKQLMGWTNSSLSGSPEDAVENAVQTVANRLKDLLLLFANDDCKADAGYLLLPGEIEQLKPALLEFVQTVFETNPYQETPILRGIYFSSGKQEGASITRLLGGLGGFSSAPAAMEPTSQGMFLHDIFSRLLPQDQGLFRPIRRYIQWRRLTRSMGFIAWTSILLCTGGLLTFSFINNMATIRVAADGAGKPLVLGPNLPDDIVLLDQYRKMLLQVQTRNREWRLVPHMQLDQSRELESALHSNYCRSFNDDFLIPLDKKLETAASSLPSNTPDRVIWDAIREMICRINLLEARIKGKSIPQLEAMPAMSGSILKLADPKIPPDAASKFHHVYLYRTGWETDNEVLRVELAKLRRCLERLTAWKGGSLQWLAELANTSESLQPVTLDRFWGAQHLTGFDKAFVPAAFTPQGKEYIDGMLDQMKQASGDSAQFEARRRGFERWYSAEYLNAWEHFCGRFDEAKTHLVRIDDWRDLATEMATPNNPYFALLDAVAEQIKPVNTDQNRAPFVAQVMRLSKARAEMKNKKAQEVVGSAVGMAKEGEKMIDKLAGKPPADKAVQDKPSDIDAVREMENILNAAKALQAYDDAAGQLLPATTSNSMAYKLISEFFPTSADIAADSPFSRANTSLLRARELLRGGQKEDAVFSMLLSGPLLFLFDYSLSEAGCYLQDQWESQVIAKLQDMPDEKLRPILFDNTNGVVWKFASGTADPFLTHTRHGYFPREAWGRRLPFKTGFCNFLNTGALQTKRVLPEYFVNVKAFPTDINDGVQTTPYCTTLELTCGDKVQQLDNYNYRSSLLFKWKPDQCGDVTLRLQFVNLMLVKKYVGEEAFPTFLTDFAGGAKTLTPDDFPEQKEDMQKYGIEQITVRYQFEGSVPVSRLLMRENFQIPGIITECWGDSQAAKMRVVSYFNSEPPRSDRTPAATQPPTQPKGSDLGNNQPVEQSEKKDLAADRQRKDYFTLKVGPVADVQTAEAMVQAFQGKGYDARYKKLQQGGKGLYQVIVGPFETRQIAWENATLLKTEPIMAGRSLKIGREKPAADPLPSDPDRASDAAPQNAEPIQQADASPAPSVPATQLEAIPTPPPPSERPKPKEEAKAPLPNGQLLYIVQVGSFKNKENADALLTTLKTKGYPAVMKPGFNQKLGNFYMVQMEPVEERDKANALIHRIEQDEKARPILIRMKQ